MNRREFLSIPLTALAAGCVGRPYRAGDFLIPARSPVCLFAASYSADLSDVIVRGLAALRVDVRRKRVMLKPNLVEYENGTSINTHPLVVAGTALAMLRSGASSVIVGEGPGHRRDVEYLLTASGLAEYLRELRVAFIDLNHDDVRRTPLRSEFTGLREMYIAASLSQVDLLVSMPKLKTHHWAGITCGMKNLFGVVPGAVYGWPKNFLHQHGIPESILDLTATVKPALTIVDGITGMEGDGPIMGRPREVGMIAMGTDIVAVDATCARVIGLDPVRIPYLSEAARFLGNAAAERVDHRGEPLSRFATRFEVLERLRPLQLD